jgi:hypothetical protein
MADAARETQPQSEIAMKDDGIPYSEEWDDIAPAMKNGKAVDLKKTLYTDLVTEWPRSRQESLQQMIPFAPWHEYKYKLKTYPQILTGTEFALWLLENNFATNEQEAQKVGQAVLDRQWIHHMKKKRVGEGFKSEPNFYFSLVPIDWEEMGNLLTNAFSSKEKAKGPGVTFTKDGNLVAARIEERQRREEGGLFTHEALRAGKDPDSMSCEMASVPIPAVLDATPDLCEWMDEWTVEIVEGKTDSAGWIYAKEEFNEQYFEPAELKGVHNVRRRAWVRHARKRPERQKIDRSQIPKKDLEEAAQHGEEADTLLGKMADTMTRVPRQGFMEVIVLHGEALWRKCDSYITVEYRGEIDKSAICKKSDEHRWNHKSFLQIKSDLDPISITVFQNNSGKQKVILGVAEFFVPEGEVDGSRTLKLKPAPGDKTAQIAGFGPNELGTVKIDWKFSVDGLAGGGSGGSSAANALARCMFTLHVKSGVGLNVDRKGLGPCGVMGTSAFRSPKVYLKAVYKGELCEMIAESKRFQFKSEIPFDWKISLDCVPSTPIQVEVCAEGFPNPFARATFEYLGATNEQSGEVPLRGIRESMAAAMNDMSVENLASAGAKLGRLVCDWVYEPLKSSFQEKVEIQEEALHNEGQGRTTSDMLKWWKP